MTPVAVEASADRDADSDRSTPPLTPPTSAVSSESPDELQLRGVGFCYPSARRQQPVEAVRDIDLQLASGALGVIVGPSGCGKSTLLRMVAGLLPPSAGTITVAGSTPSELRAAHRVGFAFQDPSLLPWRSVRRNVELPFQLAGLRVDGAWVDHLLTLVGLADWADRRPAELSGGMRQRVALARSLATRPDVLLLDEPFGALDEITRGDLNDELLRVLSSLGTTALLVTHSVEEAVQLADTVVVLTGRPATVRSQRTIDVPREQRRAWRDSAAAAEHRRGLRDSLAA